MAKKILRTRLCDMLGIEYPIILAGMGGVAGPQLVAAVSNAGGLGVLGCIMQTPEQVRGWIKKTRSLTDKPFGVDLVMPSTLPQSGTREAFKMELPAQLVSFVDELKKEFKVPDVKREEQAGAGWERLTMEGVREVFEVCLEEKVPVIAAGLGTPDWELKEAHAHGAIMMSLLGNVKIARRMDDIGVDILIAQGTEAGGHTGRIATMALLPQVVDAVHPRPVVAAGGIGDGRGLVASLALGACGVWVGSRFICTPEANADSRELVTLEEEELRRGRLSADTWKQKMLEAIDESTVISRVYTGKTARMLKNKLTERWEKSGMPYLPMPLQGILISDLQTGTSQPGSSDYSFNPCGQITGMIKEIKPAGEVVEEMVAEAIEILTKRFPAEVVTG